MNMAFVDFLIVMRLIIDRLKPIYDKFVVEN